METEQLFYPKKLYISLRNHHWQQGIPQDFTDEWILMKNTSHILTENDLLDLQILFQKLGLNMNVKIVSNQWNSNNKPLSKDKEGTINKNTKPVVEFILSIQNFPEFKKWILMKVEELEKRFKLD